MSRHRSGKSNKGRSPKGEPAEKYGEEGPAEEPSWLSRAAQAYEQRQQGYASLIAGAREAVQREKDELSTMLAKDEPEEAAPPLTIFGDAQRAYQERQKSLGAMFDDAIKSRQQERDALTQMFGSRPGKKPPRR